MSQEYKNAATKAANAIQEAYNNGSITEERYHDELSKLAQFITGGME